MAASVLSEGCVSLSERSLDTFVREGRCQEGRARAPQSIIGSHGRRRLGRVKSGS